MKEEVLLDKHKRYSKEEDAYILEHYQTTPHKIIADKLNRSVKSIRHRAEKIGCKKVRTIKKWTDEEDQLILASKGKPLNDIAIKLGRDPSDVLKRAKKLGFASWRRPDGGLYVDKRGYKVLRFENGRPIYEHRLIVEEQIGRKLSQEERVHHIDLDKKNNNPENLFLFPDARSHAICHHSINAIIEKQEDVPTLLNNGIIIFDREGGIYKRSKNVHIGDEDYNHENV